MSPSWCRKTVALVLGMVLLASQMGCDRVDVHPVESGNSSSSVASIAVTTPAAKMHDLALTAIDFDPALKPDLRFGADNITLLVAIENKGNQVERDSVVEATLYGLPGSDVLVQSQATIREIVPGESQVVRLGNFSSIPLRSAYSLKVDVHPAPGETILGNNSKIYRLEVTVSSN